MIREDALLALKKAEDKRTQMVEEAKQKSEANLAKARRDAALKIEQGKTQAAELRNTLLEARIQKINENARLVRERGKKNAERLRSVAQANVEPTVNKLVKIFEEELDV